MLIPPEKYSELVCPILSAHPTSSGVTPSVPCLGAKCMAFTAVATKDGMRAYCGLAGMPPSIAVGIRVAATSSGARGRIAVLDG